MEENEDFGWALAQLREGRAVRRRGWNGQGLSLHLQVPDKHSKMTLPYIYIEYTPRDMFPKGARCPWLASQTDLLASDWTVVP